MVVGKIAAYAARGLCSKVLPNFEKVALKGIKDIKPNQFKTGLQKTYEAIKSMEGMEGSQKFTKNQLNLLPKHLQDMLKPLLEDAKNPVARTYYKAGQKYNIAAIKITDGKDVVGTGAISVVNPGSANGVIKARLNVADKVQANGFINGSRPMDSYDCAGGFYRKNGWIKADFQTGGAGFRINGDENEIQKLLNPINPETSYGFRGQYSKVTHDIQKGFDNVCSNLRNILRGHKEV